MNLRALNLHNLRRRGNQRGVVLIMALLIVALVTTVTVSISWRFNLSVVRNMNRWHGAQAKVLLEAGEQFALQGLRLDAQLGGPVDSLHEEWAKQQFMPSPFGSGMGQLEDAHGRLNLNLMVREEDPNSKTKPKQKRLSNPQLMLLRLLQTIELEGGPIDESKAQELVDAIEDWIDIDSIPSGFGGAEGSYYETLDPPVAIPNGEMTLISELMLVKGMTPELYKQLERFVIALPGGQTSTVAGGQPQKVMPNINTMKRELLCTLNDRGRREPLDETSCSVMVRVRDTANIDQERKGFQSVGDFLNHPELKALWSDPPTYTENDFVVFSNYFLLYIELTMEDQTDGGSEDGKITRRSKSILYRPDTSGGANGQGQPQFPRVVRRTDASF